MKYSTISSAALLAASAYAVPVEKRALTDVDILQFALTLEHLENTFYKQGLSEIPYQQFIDTGFSQEYYKNLLYIAHDEQMHTELLSSAISAAGGMPVGACSYDFPFTDAYSFVSLASVLEGVGSAAYLGAAPAIMNPAYLSVAGSILVTEAIHTALHRAALNQVAPADPYGSSLGANEVFTLASAFITSCPSSNVALPFKAFPTLTLTSSPMASDGDTATFTTTAKMHSNMWITFVSGLSTVSMPAMMSGSSISATIPQNFGGQSYAILTKHNTTMVMDKNVIAGPAILDIYPLAPSIDFSEQ